MGIEGTGTREVEGFWLEEEDAAAAAALAMLAARRAK